MLPRLLSMMFAWECFILRAAAGKPASAVQTTPDKRWMEVWVCVCARLAAPNSSFERYCYLFFRLWRVFFPPGVFLRVWNWTVKVLQANDQNVSGKVVQRITTFRKGRMSFFFVIKKTKGDQAQRVELLFLTLLCRHWGLFCGYCFLLFSDWGRHKLQPAEVGTWAPRSDHYSRCDLVISFYLWR